jgi:predicted acylesterase/phospholipase RssA
MLDVDYLIDTVFKVRDRLDIEKARQSPIEWFISATDYDTGESRYVSKHDDVSPFEALRASKAAPVFFGKRVMLSGHRYIDGELGPTIGDHVRFAITKGADRIVVVSHSAPYSLRHQFMMRAYSLFVSPPMRRALIRDISANETDLTTPDATVLSVIPGELPASFATRDPDKLAATFERGIQDALAREQELRTLFGT